MNAIHTFQFLSAGVEAQGVTQDTTKCHEAESGSGYRASLFTAAANAMSEDRGRGERLNAQRE